jgi:hypothetical protein
MTKKKGKKTEEGNVIQNYNLTIKEQAKELAKQSPDVRKLIPYRVDEKTVIYFKPGTPLEKIQQRIEIYKKSLLNATGDLLFFDGSQRSANTSKS